MITLLETDHSEELKTIDLASLKAESEDRQDKMANAKTDLQLSDGLSVQGKHESPPSVSRIGPQEAIVNKEEITVLLEEDARETKIDGIDATKVTATSLEDADQIDKAYAKTTAQGAVGGLFRACMDQISKSHKEARNIRTALILLGIFTDKSLYREWIAVFYKVNLELERHMQSEPFFQKQPPKEQAILRELRKLGDQYYFTDLYEHDLARLYSEDKDWKKSVQRCFDAKPAAKQLQQHIRNMTTATELAGTLFIFWGVYIVGGGALFRQRALKMVGEDSVRLYTNVSGVGRARRKAAFINCWDDLAAAGTDEFNAVNVSADTCMDMTNAMMRDLSANPWWLKWASGTILVVTGVAVAVGGAYLRG